MPGKKIICLIKKSVYLTVLIGFFPSFSISQQEDEPPVFDEQVPMETEATEEEAEADQAEETAVETPEGETVPETVNRNFDVFRPSEEISEDLAVPFPADI